MICGTEVEGGKLLRQDPAQFFMLKDLRRSFGNARMEQGQMDGDVGVCVRRFGVDFADVKRDTQLFAAFSYERRLPGLACFHLSACELP